MLRFWCSINCRLTQEDITPSDYNNLKMILKMFVNSVLQ